MGAPDVSRHLPLSPRPPFMCIPACVAEMAALFHPDFFFCSVIQSANEQPFWVKKKEIVPET